jgi:hypothetical protein
MPTIPVIISYLRSHHRVKQILETPLVFNSQEERDQFTEAFFFHDVVADEDFWSVAMDFTLESIEENIPSTRGELKKCRDSYFKDMDFLIKEHFFVRDLDIYQGTAWEGNLKLRKISGRIGYVFCDAIDTATTLLSHNPSGLVWVIEKTLITQSVMGPILLVRDVPSPNFFNCIQMARHLISLSSVASSN